MSEAWSISDLPESLKDIVCKINLYVKDSDGEKKSIVNHDFVEKLVVNYDALEDELEQLPGIFAFWSALLAEAEEQYNLKKRKAEYKRSQLYDALIGIYDEESKKIKDATGQGIDNIPQWKAKVMVESDKGLNKTEIEVILAKKQYLKIKTIVEALKMKSEHMRSLAGFKRVEQRSQSRK